MWTRELTFHWETCDALILHDIDFCLPGVARRRSFVRDYQQGGGGKNLQGKTR